ncbi:MAG: AI-2E family transporter [Candidatus Zixiibacteriota bacterium]|nr:MAG: AI-2E family transporter [candidate division Zixibacteria bacterium]
MEGSVDHPASQADLYRKVIIGLLAVIALILAAAALKATYVISMPLAAAFFLAALLRPLQVWLNRRLPDRLHFLSLALTMLAVVVVFALFIGLLVWGGQAVADKAPQYVRQLESLWNQALNWADEQGFPLRERLEASQGLSDRVVSLAMNVFGAAWAFLGLLVLVFFLLLLMLLETADWREKTRAAFPRKRSDAVLEAVHHVAGGVRTYLLVHAAVSAISGLAAGLFLWIMGVDFALLWGVTTFGLNFLPYIGSILAVIPPTLTALVQMGPVWTLAVLAGLTVIDQVMGNYVDPRLTGHVLKISPVALLTSLVFWGWMWGAVGALLAVPLAITLIVACAHVPGLKPVARLLSRSAEAVMDEAAKEKD